MLQFLVAFRSVNWLPILVYSAGQWSKISEVHGTLIVRKLLECFKGSRRVRRSWLTFVTELERSRHRCRCDEVHVEVEGRKTAEEATFVHNASGRILRPSLRRRVQWSVKSSSLLFPVARSSETRWSNQRDHEWIVLTYRRPDNVSQRWRTYRKRCSLIQRWTRGRTIDTWNACLCPREQCPRRGTDTGIIAIRRKSLRAANWKFITHCL